MTAADRGTWRCMGLLFAGLIGANIASWMWACAVFMDRPTLLGSALLAWVFGLRHAVDPDHIAAIDNVVRKLMGRQQPARTVGLWFSLGHSTVVVLACIGVAFAATTIDLSQFGTTAATIGTSVSAMFLLTIALTNIAFLRDTWVTFRLVRTHGSNGGNGGNGVGAGPLAFLFRPMIRLVQRPWHMYPLGFLFGLGFDTATEIGLLTVAATQAAQGGGHWRVLVFPMLFTAGMALVDTADSVLMAGAYGWASVQPLRKLWYNLTITAASVAVALLIGGLEALGLVADRLGLDGPVWSVVAALNADLANLGFLVVGIFLLAWGMSVALYRWRRYDTLPVRPSEHGRF